MREPDDLRRMRGRCVTVVLGILAGTAALAQTPSSSVMTVRVQVVRSCVLNVNGPDSAMERVVVQCTGTAAPKAELSATMSEASSSAPAARVSDDASQTVEDSTGTADLVASQTASAPSSRPFRVLTINF
jgi:hypothetical protein